MIKKSKINSIGLKPARSDSLLFRRLKPTAIIMTEFNGSYSNDPKN